MPAIGSREFTYTQLGHWLGMSTALTFVVNGCVTIFTDATAILGGILAIIFGIIVFFVEFDPLLAKLREGSWAHKAVTFCKKPITKTLFFLALCILMFILWVWGAAFLALFSFIAYTLAVYKREDGGAAMNNIQTAKIVAQNANKMGVV